jgi:hypothetical protein
MGNQILFPENCKVSNSQSIRVLGATQKITNQLELIVEADSIIWDRALFVFKTNASDSIDFFDAKKLMNPDCSLFSWSAEKVKLCIDTRSSLHPTRIPLGLVSSIPKTYHLKIRQLPEFSGFDFYLIDKIAAGKTLLKTSMSYTFQIDSLTSLNDSSRFEIQILAKSVAFNSIELPKLSCQVFPNPTNNQLSLLIQSTKLLPVFITIKNALGQPFLNQKLEPALQINHSILMNKWSAGIYILTISNKEETITQKIIKY